MNVKIISLANNHDLHYEIRMNTTTSFCNSTITLHGAFGKVTLEKVDIPDCVLWKASCALTESILIRLNSEEPVLQISLAAPSLLEELSKLAEDTGKAPTSFPLLYTYQSHPAMQLDTAHKECFFLHYGSGYFLTEHRPLLEQLTQTMSLLSATGKRQQELIPSNALLLVLQQIISYPLDDAYRARYLKAKTEELLIHFLKQAEIQDRTLRLFGPKDPEQLQQAITLLKDAPGENLTNFQLAKKTGMNAFALKKKFKAFTGLTIQQFRLKVRMEQAEQLLSGTDLPVKDIALQTGFKNLSNFSEAFKKYFGTTPSDLRKKR